MPTTRLFAATLLILWLVLAAPASGREFLSRSATLDTPTSRTDEFPLSLEARSPFTLEATITLRQGRVQLQIRDQEGRVLHSSAAREFAGIPYSSTLEPGNYTLAVTAEDAAGTWTLRADDRPFRPRPAISALHMAPGLLMIAVAVAAALACRYATGERWRWFWVGALLWTVAVAAKAALAVPLNGPILGILKEHLPDPIYLAVGSAYIGLLTGITEVAMTFGAGLRWRRLASTPGRALAIGTGAGAIEALLLGVASMVALVVAAINTTLPEMTVTAVLVAPFERIVVLFCHVAVRAMTLYAVATRGWRWFWVAFVFFSALDGVAGYYHLAGLVGSTNPWWIELPLAAFAIAGVLLVMPLIRRWPASERAPVPAAPLPQFPLKCSR
jgi:hypothetical protein